MAMIAETHLLVLVFSCDWTGDQQRTGHHPGPLDPGGDAPQGW
jgi:hypothetical protein